MEFKEEHTKATDGKLTKEKFLAKIDCMTKRITKQLERKAVKKAEHIFDSGGIEPEDWGDNFELPMAVMKIILEEEARGYTLVTKHAEKTYNNLKHF